ncbi:MAG: acyltransferase family protein [Bacteroidaceae bacterium]|nr:acyltransferase family protein [Bacteroidaceae bacterium]
MKRESNIELLRIVAMFMVLGLHATFSALGPVNATEVKELPTQSFIRLLTENVCIVGVNVFVLISGWFGIKFKCKGLSNFIFQCLFFSCIVFIPFFYSGQIEANRINVLSIFLLYHNAYWFVWAYIILYISAPILNSFIEHSDRKDIRTIIILLLVVQTVIVIFTRTGFYKSGFSPLSFINLYLLARYFKLYIKLKGKYRFLFLYILCVMCNSLAYYIPVHSGISNDTIYSISKAYTNPLNIISALSLLIFFTRINIKSKIINWLASSCFAVYLLHMHFCLRDHYTELAKEIFSKYSGIEYLAIIIAFITAVFAASVLIDKIRIFCFNFLWNKYEKHKYRNDHP